MMATFGETGYGLVNRGGMFVDFVFLEAIELSWNELQFNEITYNFSFPQVLVAYTI